MNYETKHMPRPVCERCGDIIGVFEPVSWVIGDHVIATSRAAQPDIASPDRAGRIFHAGCYAAMRRESEPLAS